MIEEIWKIYRDTRTIPCGCLWEVSNYGRLKRNGELKEPRISNSGYPQFSHGDFVHRAVVELFIGKIPKGYEVDHIDTNPRNNKLTNLRIVTSSENKKNPITRTKNADSHKGKEPWNKGKKGLFQHSEESKKKTSSKTKGNLNGMYGRRKIWNEDHTEYTWIKVA